MKKWAKCPIWMTLLSVSLLYPLCVGRCTEAGGGSKPFELTGREVELRKKDRRERVSPVRPSTGISTGLIIAYGHPIEPPYQFEYRGRTLFVNGVQLLPTPFSARERNDILEKAGATKSERYEAAQRIQGSAVHMRREGKSREEILSFIRSHDDIVAEAKWTSDRSLNILYKGEKRPVGVEFMGDSSPQKTTSPKPESKPIADKEAFKNEQIRHFESQLRRGTFIFVQSDNRTTSIRDRRREIREVMTRTDLTADQKLARVSDFLDGNNIAAFDVMANFDPSEWGRAP